MSRGFIKDDDGDNTAEVPARKESGLPNYVTRRGLRALEAKVDALRQRLEALAEHRADKLKVMAIKETEADLAYYRRRLESAIPVEPDPANAGTVRFGARVTLRRDGAPGALEIVGEDEADPEHGRVAWSSPLAEALLGAAAGESVPGPGGETLEVLSVSYEGA